MQDMIDAETTIFAYQYYVKACSKREQTLSKNNIFA